MSDTLGPLIAHLCWADLRTLESLQGIETPRGVELFAHIVGSEHTWLSRLHGVAPTLAIWSKATLEECAVWLRENHRQFQALVAGGDAGTSMRAVSYTNSAGQAFTSTVHDILTHVALHGMYHRGQIAAIVREAGGTPFATDFVVYVRGAATPPASIG